MFVQQWSWDMISVVWFTGLKQCCLTASREGWGAAGEDSHGGGYMVIYSAFYPFLNVWAVWHHNVAHVTSRIQTAESLSLNFITFRLALTPSIFPASEMPLSALCMTLCTYLPSYTFSDALFGFVRTLTQHSREMWSSRPTSLTRRSVSPSEHLPWSPCSHAVCLPVCLSSCPSICHTYKTTTWQSQQFIPPCPLYSHVPRACLSFSLSKYHVCSFSSLL